ncbi:hypothetical protein ANDROMEDA_54 [Bacillus phage Andromeda]|uniref:Uncharacterized protein n=3 Tax=Andromedavirus TaxID=1623275 RepID=M1IEN0_9CAUD|nr:hypothetical protein I905_gp54 [Bacillus phage Andromeda]YP_008770687.1 hypothetical protein Glittering_51 [Bacillus phage Glittering]AGE60893.1 hypothetical protein GEMINI_54 [Bacillus phage Gemini]AGE61124.1 hypothetical protein ANDROMEDA_54 [Bacillus phage Andromeda]AGY47238.1 hypothetical protein Glittering_51 [Bacillus phage Glittering]
MKYNLYSIHQWRWTAYSKKLKEDISRELDLGEVSPRRTSSEHICLYGAPILMDYNVNTGELSVWSASKIKNANGRTFTIRELRLIESFFHQWTLNNLGDFKEDK